MHLSFFQMVLDSLSRANVSPRRPSSLLLPGLSGSGSHTRQSREQDKNNNVTAEMIDIHSNIGVKRNRKKRRAADAGVKKFDGKFSSPLRTPYITASSSYCTPYLQVFFIFCKNKKLGRGRFVR